MIEITFDQRTGVSDSETISKNIKLKFALERINKLDGNFYTLVMLDRNDGWQMMIGGGPENYIVTLCSANENFSLHNKNGDIDKYMEICAGGQYGDYPEMICINIKQTKVAVSAFFKSLEQKLKWV